MRLTLDEALLRKFQGWEMKEFLFLSVIGELSFLRDFHQLERHVDYAGIRGMSVILVCSKSNPTDAYREAEKMIEYGVGNLGLWVLGEPNVRELVFSGYRPKHEGTIFLDGNWAAIVKQFHEASS